MKRILSVLLAMLLIVAMLSGAALADTTKTVYISSTGKGSLNLRSGPGKNYSVSGYVYHGNKVTVKDSSGEWSKVKVNKTGKTGWIKTRYIDGTTKALGTGYKTIKVSGSVKLRSGPGTSYASKGTLKNGTAVKVVETEDNWAKITVKSSGKTGWVMLKYISDDAPVSPTPTEYKVRSVTADSLNIRKGAGTEYGKVGILHKGDAIKVLGSSGNWYHIQTVKGLKGWVSKTYTKAGATAKVKASSLNVRKGAGTAYGVSGTLKKGKAVTVDAIVNGWAHVKYGSKSGYVSAKYLTF